MSRAASLLEGEHDFSAFSTGCGAKTTVRTVHSITLARYDSIDFMTAKIQGDFIKIRIEANAFCGIWSEISSVRSLKLAGKIPPAQVKTSLLPATGEWPTYGPARSLFERFLLKTVISSNL
jgi:hypothetical protein